MFFQQVCDNYTFFQAKRSLATELFPSNTGIEMSTYFLPKLCLESSEIKGYRQLLLLWHGFANNCLSVADLSVFSDVELMSHLPLLLQYPELAPELTLRLSSSTLLLTRAFWIKKSGLPISLRYQAMLQEGCSSSFDVVFLFFSCVIL